jgi:DNA-binding response OmpR family regulator
MNGERRDKMPERARILIVEDQTPVTMMMAFLLTRAGCETEMATTGAEAVQLVQTSDFDLITLEVDLPGMNGFEICRQLKENPRSFDTPVVFVSKRDSLENQQQGLELGAADYITKPFDALDFAPRLLSHMKATSDSLAMMENTVT